MTKKALLLPVLVVVGFVLVGCGLLREPEEASGPVEAIPLEVQATVMRVACRRRSWRARRRQRWSAKRLA